MRPRRNPFTSVSRALARSDSDVVVRAAWLRGPNKVLLDRGVFVPANPRRCVDCPRCGGTADVRGAASAVCEECGLFFPVDRKDLLQYKFSFEGMASFMEDELNLTNRMKLGSHDWFRAPNGRSVCYIHRAGAVDRSRLRSERDPYLIYGSSDLPPRDESDLPGMEMATMDSVFDVEESGGVWTCRHALDLTQSVARSAASVTKKNEKQQARWLLLAKMLRATLRHHARTGEDFEALPPRHWHEAFAAKLKRLAPVHAVSYKTVENDVKALCGEGGSSARSPDFMVCWKALLSGRADVAAKALAYLKDAAAKARSRGVPPEALMLSGLKFQPDGHYADEEIDPDSPVDSDSAFYVAIDENLGSRET